MTVRVATFGGTVQSVLVPDRFGEPRNVALGFPALDGYVANSGCAGPQPGPPYFGAIVGRYVNRIAERSFVLDGERFELAGNDGPDDSVSAARRSGRLQRPGVAGRARVRRFGPRRGRLGLRRGAAADAGGSGWARTGSRERSRPRCSTRSRPTTRCGSTTGRRRMRRPCVNLTNHTYFNLAGEGSGASTTSGWRSTRTVVQPVDRAADPGGVRVRGRHAVRLPGDEADRPRHRGRGGAQRRAVGDRPWLRPQLGADRPRLPAGRGGLRSGERDRAVDLHRPARPAALHRRTSWSASWSGPAGAPTARAMGSRSRPSTSRTRRTTSAIRTGRRWCCGPVRSSHAGRRTASRWRGRSWASGLGSSRRSVTRRPACAGTGHVSAHLIGCERSLLLK